MIRCRRQDEFMPILKRMGAFFEVSQLAQSQGNNWPAPLVFQNLSLRWQMPSFHMILGPSGGGKSTLLKTMAGVWRPLKGTIKIGDDNLWDKGNTTANKACTKKIGYAFQNNALFSSMRVIENLSYPMLIKGLAQTTTEAHERSIEWLKKVGLESSAWVYPAELSGGMQKRLAIARALISTPELLFLDDPTAGLDPVTSQKLMALINELTSQNSGLVVLVTNDIDRAKESKANLHFLENGKLVSSGDLDHPAYQERFLR